MGVSATPRFQLWCSIGREHTHYTLALKPYLALKMKPSPYHRRKEQDVFEIFIHLYIYI